MKDTIIHIRDRVLNSDIGHRIVAGAFWSFTGTALAKGIVLAASVLCAHILSKEGYGQFGMIRSTINMFVVFGAAGMGVTATKYISEYRKNFSERIASIYMLTNGFALCMGIVITSLVVMAAPFVADRFLHSPDLTSSIRIGGILLFVSILNGAQNGTLLGFEDFRGLAVNTFFGSLAESVCMLLGATWMGVEGAIMGYGMGYVVLYAMNNVAIHKNLQKHGIQVNRHLFQRSDLKLIYSFSLPAAVSSLLTAPTYWAIKAILVNQTDFRELATYEAAEQWRSIILFIPSAVSQIVLPILSSIANESANRFWIVLKINLALNAGVALIISMVVGLFSQFVMSLYGSEYVNGSCVLSVLAASTVFSTSAAVIGLSLTSKAKTWIGMLFNAFWALMMISFSSLLIPKYGALGISLSILYSYIVHTLLQLIYLHVNMHPNVNTKN